jgi:hypothetical protein
MNELLVALVRFLASLGVGAWLVIALEVLAFSVAMRHLTRAGRAYQREDAALERIRSLLGDMADREDEAVRTRERIHSDFVDAPADAQQQGAVLAEFADTATAALVRTYVHAARLGDVPEPGSALAAAEARLQGGLALPRTVAGLLVLIGLGGTLLGLTQAVVGISTRAAPIGPSASDSAVSRTQTAQAAQEPAADSATAGTPPPGVEVARGSPVQVADSDSARGFRAGDGAELEGQIGKVNALLGGIETTLAGMRTAFVPALCSVGLTVLLLWFLHYSRAREAHVLAQLEEVSGAVLRPLFRPFDPRRAFRLPADVLEASSALIKGSETAARTLTEAVEEVRRGWKVGVHTAGKALRATVKDGADTAAKALQATVKDGADTAAGALRKSMDEGLAGVRKATEGLAQQVGEVAEEIAEPVRTAAKRLEEATRTHGTALAEAVGRASTAAGAAATASEQLTERLTAIDRVGSQLSSALESGTATAGALKGVEARIAEALELVGKQVERSRQSADSLATVGAPLVNASKDLQRMRDMLAELLSDQQKLRRDSLALFQAHTRVIEDLVHSVEGWMRETSARALEAASAPSPPAAPAREGGDSQRIADYLLETLAKRRAAEDDRWKRRVGSAVRKLNQQNAGMRTVLKQVGEALEQNSELLRRIEAAQKAGALDGLDGERKARTSPFPWLRG